MKYVIKYMKSFEFVGTEEFDGTLEEAIMSARSKLAMLNADAAAVSLQNRPDDAPLELITAD